MVVPLCGISLPLSSEQRTISTSVEAPSSFINSNCAVIGHFTCQTATSLGRAGCRIVTRSLSLMRVGSGHETIQVMATIFNFLLIHLIPLNMP